MKHPPYHLRVNKAVDRFLFIELIGLLCAKFSYINGNYYGFGGPFLEDFKLIHHYFPSVSLTSLEKNQATYKRQQLHKHTQNLTLINEDLTSFLTGVFTAETNDIFWLDYTGLKMDYFTEFMRLLTQAEPESLIKITLRSDWLDANEKNNRIIGKRKKDFIMDFGTILPKETITARSLRLPELPFFIQKMINIAAQKCLGGQSLSFELLHSCTYNDGTPMVSITGMLCSEDEAALKTRQALKEWRFSNHDWNKKPHSVNVPILSQTERTRINKFLPVKTRSSKRIANRLGYNIENGRRQTEDALLQYADFYRHYPSFVKMTP